MRSTARGIIRPPWLGLAFILSACGGRTELSVTAGPSPVDAGLAAVVVDGASVPALGDATPVCGASGQACCRGNSCAGALTCAGSVCTEMAGEGTVVLFGGEDSNNQSQNDTWTFDGASWTLVPISKPPSRRAYATMATLGSTVVLFGGSGGYGDGIADFLNDTWTFDGSSWSQVSVTTAPSARARASMATLGSTVVLFGGEGDGAAGAEDDTWVFNGSSWSEVRSPRHPPARVDASMATLGDQIVLFGGGTDVGGNLNDTWTFDGTSWTRVSAANPPAGRTGASLAALGDQLVLFGGDGVSVTTACTNETWTFGGASWSPVMLTAPPVGRCDASMTTLGSELVLYGGIDAFAIKTVLGDTWTFDAASWTQVTTSDAPPARGGASMALLP